jgi:hypothetical protein
VRQGLLKFLVLAAVSLHAATPGVSVAVSPGGCECSGPEGARCGVHGFLCRCCLLPADACEEVSFSTCKGTASFEAHTQPPAVYEPLAGTEPIFYLTPSVLSPRAGPEEGFHFLRDKPPSAS